MSELETARDHARTMATMTVPVTRQATVIEGDELVRRLVVVTPVPTEAERRLWVQIADEIDHHLHQAPDDEPALDLGGEAL